MVAMVIWKYANHCRESLKGLVDTNTILKTKMWHHRDIILHHNYLPAVPLSLFVASLRLYEDQEYTWDDLHVMYDVGLYHYKMFQQYLISPLKKWTNVHIIQLSIHLSIHSSIHLSIHSSIHLSIYPSIHSSIHLFIQVDLFF